jgi:cold shock CspA family protein
VIVSSRKSGYQNLLGIPTFELQELSDAQIENFLSLSFADLQLGRHLYEKLKENPQLMEWARNPLLLRMLTKVAGRGEIPRNRGQMLKRFVCWILSRERKTQPTNIETKEDVLAHLAFEMRKAGNTAVEKPVAVELIREKLVHLSPGVGANDLFQELVENQLLKRTQHDEVRFFHELIQEYFAARELTRLFLLDTASIAELLPDTRWEEPVILMAGFLARKGQLIQTLCDVNLLLAAKCVAPLRDESPDLFDLVKGKGAESLRQMCRDVKSLGFTRRNIREVVGGVSILRDETAIQYLCEQLPSFPLASHDALLEGLASCDRSVLHRVLLDPAVFERLTAGQKGDYLMKLWFRAIEDLTSVADIERAIALCRSVGSALSVQIACGFDPEVALRDINPFRLNLEAKSLRKLFSLVRPEKHATFLRRVFSEDYNPLRLAAAIRLADTNDESVLQFLIQRCASGEHSERGHLLAVLSHYGKPRVSEAALQLLSRGTITIQQLLSKPLGDYIGVEESVVRASLDSAAHVVSLLSSGWSQGQTRSTLNQIEKYGLGGLLRDPLIELLRASRAEDASQMIKRQMCVYKALKGQRFRGVIMLLDAARGIGSIWCDETQYFYFLHQKEVWDSTPLAIFDAVEFEVATGRKPKKDFEAVKVSKLAQVEERGTVKEILPERRFGFIQADTRRPAVFFHFENTAEAELSRLAPGVRVAFIVVPALKQTQSIQAARVRVV